QREFLVFNRAAQHLFLGKARRDRRFEHRIVKVVTVAAAVFDLVHGDLGVLDQGLIVAAVGGIHRNAGAGRDELLETLQAVGLFDLAQQVERDVGQLFAAAGVPN